MPQRIIIGMLMLVVLTISPVRSMASSSAKEQEYLKSLPGALKEIWETDPYIKACWKRYVGGDLKSLKALYYIERSAFFYSKLIRAQLDILSESGSHREKARNIRKLYLNYDLASLKSLSRLSKASQDYCVQTHIEEQ